TCPSQFSSRYLLQYQEPMPCEQLVTALCDIKQAYTQFGGRKLSLLSTFKNLKVMFQDYFEMVLKCLSIVGSGMFKV
uniref:Uncharacterized protein n=1 Tax=Hippocampus comes TaxID=109280 RepID=A0A3Q2XIH5_HIPCM